jgi:leader peptidase (prepilin peptidase) / N-methyltransferase
MFIALAALSGLIIGSFLNVVIHRLPRGESLSSPPSHCPNCGAQVRPYDNVPVLSWLILRGRCRSCGAPISFRYPLVEAGTAALYVAVVLVKGADRDVWLGLVFVTLLIPVALIDLDRRIIPNRLLAPAAVAAIAIQAAVHPGKLPEHLIAAGAAGGFFLLAALAYPRGMGMGDVKLAAVMGLFLGRSVGPALLAAMIAGTLAGMVVIARKGAEAGRKTAVPFGPFLALGGVLGLLAGGPIVDWYLSTFT